MGPSDCRIECALFPPSQTNRVEFVLGEERLAHMDEVVGFKKIANIPNTVSTRTNQNLLEFGDDGNAGILE
jgi:hypothetical protein